MTRHSAAQPASSISTSTSRQFSDLRDLPGALRDSLGVASTGEFFSSIDWFTCLARYGFVDPPRLRLLAGSGDGSSTSNVYLLCLKADPAGRRLSSLTNCYTTAYNGFAGKGMPSAELVADLARALASGARRMDELELRYLASNNEAVAAFSSAFGGLGYRVRTFHDRWNWYENVDGISFPEYWDKRPARLRNTLRRKVGKARATYRIRFEQISEPRQLAAGLADYQHVYANSWKEPEAASGFIPALMRLCADLGIMRLGVLYLDERPVAVQFWIVSGGKAYIYKLAHDRNFDALSVGSILTRHMFEWVIEKDKVAEIDFGTGNESYKSAWTQTRRELIRLHAVSTRSVRGAMVSVRLCLRDMLLRVRRTSEFGDPDRDPEVSNRAPSVASYSQ